MVFLHYNKTTTDEEVRTTMKNNILQREKPQTPEWVAVRVYCRLERQDAL